MTSGRTVRRIAQTLAGLACGLVLVEVGFRWRDHGAFPHLNIYVADQARGVRLQPGATERISFSGNPVTSVRINSDGYRGADWTGKADVVVVGDSQVFGLGVEEADTFAAELARRSKLTVRNAGVPTYGPDEYNAVLAELLPKQKPKTVIWTVNMANDLFEAAHPNPSRHLVWDGWAVRKENAPSKQTAFPFRRWLMGKSHAVYAMRGAWFRLGAQVEEGVASEGTWKDLSAAGQLSDAQRKSRQAAAEADRVRRQTEAGATLRNLREVDNDLYKRMGTLLTNDEYGPGTLRAATANPGDIVRVYYGEGSRPVPATAAEIKAAADARTQLAAAMQDKHDKAGLGALVNRDRLSGQLKTILSSTTPALRTESPLRAALQKAKALCDANGAELVVLVLPLDVQVSSTEWAKYHATPIDLTGTRVLAEDVLSDADELGARGVDAWTALAKAEPGAFLDGDLHMTAKGHAAVAAAIAETLAGAVAAAKPAPPPPLGRSSVPTATEWRTAVRFPREGKEPQEPIDYDKPVDLKEIHDGGRLFGALDELVRNGCTMYAVREWFRVSCKKGTGAIEAAGRSEAMLVNTVDGVTLVAAFVEGDRIRARFMLPRHTLNFWSDWALGEDLPELRSYPRDKKAEAVAPTAAETALCACHQKNTGAADCSALTGTADPDCARTYGNDCAQLLRCARGDGAAPPICGANRSLDGVTHRCVSDGKKG